MSLINAQINVPIILASASPRRVELLKNVGIICKCVPPQIDETPQRGETAIQLVKRLCKEKAGAVMENALHEFGAAVIIAADTIVVPPSKILSKNVPAKNILGKPKNDKDAFRMLSLLSGKTHEVVTGYCILVIGREMKPEIIVKTVSTKVTFRKLTPKMIKHYISTQEPHDKAGAYAAQGLGMGIIEKVSGSYTNVIGLPVTNLLQDLEKKFGISSLRD